MKLVYHKWKPQPDLPLTLFEIPDSIDAYSAPRTVDFLPYLRIKMKLYLNIAQIVVSVLLIGSILLQSRGTGLSGTFGGEGNVFRTKRGVEKIVFHATIVLGILFFSIALTSILLPQA